MTTVPVLRERAIVAGLMLASAAACARRPDVARPGASGPSGSPNAARPASAPALAAVYDSMGLVAARGDMPFVASLARFATASADSSLVQLNVSLTNRALTFQREGDHYRAPYEVRVEVRRGGDVVRRLASDEIVRVATFRETARTDESVLFSQGVVLAPASYTFNIALRDATSGRSTAKDITLTVPPFAAGAFSSAVVAYDATPRARLDSAPRIVPRPRATAAFGQDTSVSVYVEAYGGSAAPVPVRVAVRGDRGALVWSDSASLASTGALHAGTLRLPVARLGIGIVQVDVVGRGARMPNGTDSTRTPLFVSLGPDLPVVTFDDVLGYLRYYASPERIRQLRDASPDARPAAWLAFLHAADESGATPGRATLRDYFARLRVANQRFDEAQPGWTTDRGMAYVVLGEPDQITDPAGQDANARGRTQVWEYRAAQVTLTFEDKNASGRWRFTPTSAAAVQAALRRAQIP